MKYEAFMAVVPAPGMCLIEVWDDSEPCASMASQFCRVLRFAPDYDGPIDPGARVLISQGIERSHLSPAKYDAESKVYTPTKQAALIPYADIVGVAK